MDGSLGSRRGLSVRSDGRARRGLFHRHATADRQRLAARRPRLLLYPHRHPGPLSPDARARRVLSDGLGRQRPANRTSRPELLRRQVRPVAAVRRVVHATGEARQAGHLGVTAQLHRALRAAHRGRREGLRGPVADVGPVGGLGDDLFHRGQGQPARLATCVPAAARPRHRLSARGADALGRGLPHGRGAGGARGPRDPRRVPQAALHARRRRRDRDRHHTPGTAGGLRRAGGASRRRAFSGAFRHRRPHAAVQGPCALQGPPARQPREGHRRRDDLHLWRHHGRDVVA